MLFNFHLGDGVSGTGNEWITWDPAYGCYIESGRSDAPVAVYWPLVPPDRHGATPENPYQLVEAGGEMIDVDAAGPTDDVVAGFQFNVPDDGILQPGESFWVGAAVAFLEAQDMESFEAYLRGADPRQLMLSEVAFWDAWHASDVLPAGLSADERRLARMALAWLKMGQVREPPRDGGNPAGQILASLPPGQWNIAWVRDAAYAIMALARSGHLEEAREAVRFFLNGQAGGYSDLVGTGYWISVCRYYGSGLEWSDENQDGPNIEFDDFGLFLLSLDAVRDQSFLDEAWLVASIGAADVLVFLLEEQSNLLRPDSSIWEHHWNGKQKHFTYSSAVGAAGLCRAAEMAEQMGDSQRASDYLDAALLLQAGIKDNLVDSSDVLAGNLEELTLGSAYLDAAVVEAFLFDVIPTDDPVAAATFDELDAELGLSTGGLKRNDDLDWYDAQEWVMIDLRMSALAFLMGRNTRGQELLDRITRLTDENLGLFPELFEAGTDTAAGAIPMAGFGAGAYLLALWAREDPQAPAFCRRAEEPDGGADDGGDEGADPGGDDAGMDAGADETKVEPPGCGCGAGTPGGLWLLGLFLWRFRKR
jgi:GH15 family glucan-1,4-alpha-glucosidase